MHGDVVDGNLADAALERARMRVPVCVRVRRGMTAAVPVPMPVHVYVRMRAFLARVVMFVAVVPEFGLVQFLFSRRVSSDGAWHRARLDPRSLTGGGE